MGIAVPIAISMVIIIGVYVSVVFTEAIQDGAQSASQLRGFVHGIQQRATAAFTRMVVWRDGLALVAGGRIV